MQISRKVMRVLEAEKISADELYRMLDEVAFTSVRGSNRRYFQWLFTVRNNVLLDMQRAEVVQVGRGPNRMLEEHEACDGEGCQECGWVGQVSRAIVDTTAAMMA